MKRLDVCLDISIKSSLLDNKPLTRPPYYWQMGGGKNPQWAVRSGAWKLIANPKDTSIKDPKSQRLKAGFFLANVDIDPGEQTNLATRNPEKLDELREIGRALQAEWK